MEYTQEEIQRRLDESVSWLDANYQSVEPLSVDCAYAGVWKREDNDDAGMLVILRVTETGKTISFRLDEFSSSMMEGCVKEIRERLQDPSFLTQEDLVTEPLSGILQ